MGTRPVIQTKVPVTGLFLLGALTFSVGAASIPLTISAPHEIAREGSTPISIRMDISKLISAPVQAASLQLRSLESLEKSEGSSPIPAQFEPDKPDSLNGTVRWVMPGECMRITSWVLELRDAPWKTVLRAGKDPRTGQWDIRDAGGPVLRYNCQTNDPGEVLARVKPEDRKYARARGDYIHPLYGFEGEELTRDWSPDHPHHRGIYWAWPEVDYHGERGDLHALQRVFARPTGRCVAEAGPVFARIEAENLWLWEDREAIVRERTAIRVWRADAHGRFIDLELQFSALKDEVAIARRETRLYGGLNVRLAPAKEQQITFHTDPAGNVPRGAWAELSGLFAESKAVTGLAIFQKPTNPDYPGDWVQYPEINWFQPTFPSAGSRYVLKKDQPLVLQFRLWLHAGRAEEAELRQAWRAYAAPPPVMRRP